eukprot:scaffold313633_cov31-Tisochrysis_lutea.AAC.3
MRHGGHKRKQHGGRKRRRHGGRRHVRNIMWRLQACVCMWGRRPCALWVVVGTSRLRFSSSAACTDQASMPGRSTAARTAEGEGATVETDILVEASRKPCGSVRSASALRTDAGLLSGSPMPMKTRP